MDCRLENSSWASQANLTAISSFEAGFNTATDVSMSLLVAVTSEKNHLFIFHFTKACSSDLIRFDNETL